MERHRITRYVEPLREGGSLPGLVETDDDGLYVVKLRGAGQGVRALVSEIVVGELARALGLRVPDLALLDLDASIGRAEPDPEIQALLLGSVGDNVGLDFLPGSLPFAIHAGHTPEADESAAVVWLDLVTTNVDRTPRNPNLLWWHGRLWLIDHGAALYRQHAATLNADEADRPFPQIVDHILLGLLGDDPAARLATLRAAHDRLAPLVTGQLLVDIAAQIPDEWVDGHDYAGYLAARVDAVGRWLADIDGLQMTGSATTGPAPAASHAAQKHAADSAPASAHPNHPPRATRERAVQLDDPARRPPHRTGERLNVAAAVFCRRHRYLGFGYVLDAGRLHALDPALDLAALERQLDGLQRVAAGDPGAGRVAGMDPADRFGFIAAPSSTVLQPAPVHVGLCDDDPAAALDDLLDRYVRL